MKGRGSYHVSHTVRETMLSRPSVRYFRIDAVSAAVALTSAQAQVKNPDLGEWTVARAESDARAAA